MMPFEFSDRVRALQSQLKQFMDKHVYPVEFEYIQYMEASKNPWATHPMMED